jgi:hypothetical protein
MTRPLMREHNQQTGEVVDREMNDEEFAAFELYEIQRLAAKAEAQAKATQKAALLERLGITEDEAKLLLA